MHHHTIPLCLFLATLSATDDGFTGRRMNFFRALVNDVCGVIKKIAQTRKDLCVQPALNISDCLFCGRIVFLCGGCQEFHAVLPIIARVAVKQSDLRTRPEVKPGGFFKMSKPLFGLPVLIIQFADFIR